MNRTFLLLGVHCGATSAVTISALQLMKRAPESRGIALESRGISLEKVTEINLKTALIAAAKGHEYGTKGYSWTVLSNQIVELYSRHHPEQIK
mgnify:CR=1 FL=1